MEITQVEIRRHRQRDGANDTIQLTALVGPGENALDVIDALDDIIRQRLFTPQPKAVVEPVAAPVAEGTQLIAPAVKSEVVVAVNAALLDRETVQASSPVEPVAAPVAEGVTAEAFNARVAAVGKRPGGAKCVITALSGFGVAKVGAIPVERRQEFLTAVNG